MSLNKSSHMVYLNCVPNCDHLFNYSSGFELVPEIENVSQSYLFKTNGFLSFGTIFLLTIWCIKILKDSRQKCPGKSLNQNIPVVKWFSPSLPIIEGFISLLKLRDGGVKVVEKLVSKYGTTFHLPLPLTKTIATADPDIYQKLLSSSNIGHLNHPRPFYDYIATDYLKDGLLVADVDIWAPHRKAVSQAFTYKSFPTYLNFMNEGARNLVKFACDIASKNQNGTFKNEHIKSFIDHQAVKIITEVIMGSETFDITDEERIKFHESFKIGKDISLERFLHPEQFLPFVWFFHPNKKALKSAIDVATRFSYKMTENYRKRIKLGNVRHKGSKNECESSTENDDDSVASGVKPFKCLLELLISAGLSNKEISDEVATILIGGHETVVTALDMLIFHLAANPKIQEKCRLEIAKLFISKERTTNNGLSMDDLSELKYLERCIFESLRITPTVPFSLRRLDTPLEIKKNCYIKAGHTIMLMTWALHRNPEIYPNPEVYDPDRFLPENVKNRHSYGFTPFLMGQRNCVGWKLALMEMKVFMAFILRYFEMTTTDKLTDVKMLFDVTLKPERSYNVEFRKREHVGNIL